MPCHDDTVLVELWNGGSTSAVLMATLVLDFFELIKNETPTRWFNFYWRPPTEGLNIAKCSKTLYYYVSRTEDGCFRLHALCTDVSTLIHSPES